MVPKSLLAKHSEYFPATLNSPESSIEPQTKVFNFDEIEREHTESFLDWLRLCTHCKRHKEYAKNHKCVKSGPEARWCQPGIERDWVFGDRFLSRDYKLFCLSHFVQHLDNLNEERVRWIYKNTTKESALRRVMCQYILVQMGENTRGLLNVLTDLEQDEGSEGHAVLSTRNPKTYMVEHWESECSADLNADCEHRILPEPSTVGTWTREQLQSCMERLRSHVEHLKTFSQQVQNYLVSLNKYASAALLILGLLTCLAIMTLGIALVVVGGHKPINYQVHKA